MSNSSERRVSRALATTNDVMARSQRVIWCFEADQMPAMIDLLIQQGRLGESDRPSCVHWRAIKGAGSPTDEEISLIADAEEMLVKAGIRTLTAEAWEAPCRARTRCKPSCGTDTASWTPTTSARSGNWSTRWRRSGLLARELPRPASTHSLGALFLDRFRLFFSLF